jgi:hypothetical protein
MGGIFSEKDDFGFCVNIQSIQFNHHPPGLSLAEYFDP